MKRLLSIAVIAIAAAFSAAPVHAAGKLSDAQLVQLQALLQRHIDSNLVDGAIPQIDNKDGHLLNYFPTKAHPKIMTTDNFIILCADFVDGDGKQVMANFYVANSNDHYVVFQSTFGHDPALEHLMKSGAAEMAN